MSSSRGLWLLPKIESGLDVTRVTAHTSGTRVERNFMTVGWVGLWCEELAILSEVVCFSQSAICC